jgi:ABC-type Fe3+/spermidine/putrescine transport system ATPase subunit
VAGFIGRSSSLRARIGARQGDQVEVEIGSARVKVSGADALPPGASVIVMARPEAFILVPAGNASLKGTVTGRRFVGGTGLFTVALAGGETLELSAPPQAVSIGQEVGLEPAGRGLHLFPGTGP